MLLPNSKDTFITDRAVFSVNMSWMCKCERSILLWFTGEKYELHTATPTTPSVVVHVCEDEQVGNPVPNDSDQDDKARAPRPKIIQTRRPDYTPRIEQWMMKKNREHSVAAVTICPEAIGRELDMLLELWRRFEDFGNAPEGAAVSYRWAFHMMEWENIVSNAAFKSHGKGKSVKESEKMATVWRRSIHL